MQQAGKAAAASLLLPAWACNNAEKTDAENAEGAEQATENQAIKGNLGAFGIQLWTLRDVIGEDPKATLKTLAGYGYGQIESFEGQQGMFWGMKPAEFASYVNNDLGMNLIASHCNIMEGFEEKAAQAAEAGMKYLICPWVGPQESMDDFKRITERFNECGDICKANGIRFAYHNHDYSFAELDGEIPQDYMMDNTNPDTVDFEMDMYWVIVAGVDPLSYFERYPNRFRLAHVKDRMKEAPAEEKQASCTLGKGSIDYPPLLAAAKTAGISYFILEQERYDGTTPMEGAEDGAAYLSGVQI